MKLSEWENLCLNGGCFYYWDDDNVVVADPKHCAVTYKSGELIFIVDHAKMPANKVFLNEHDCANDHIQEVKERFSIKEA